jgi:hypothetical protein
MAGIHQRKPLRRSLLLAGNNSPPLTEQHHSQTTIRDARILEALVHQSIRRSVARLSGVEAERPSSPTI